MNEDKTEYMILRRRGIVLGQSIKIDHYEFKMVNVFKYLVTILTENNDDTANEVAARTQAGNKCYEGIVLLWALLLNIDK